MRVLILTTFAIPHVGGASTHVELLISGLRSRGHDVRLIQGTQTACPRWRRGFLLLSSLGNRDRYRAAILRDQARRLRTIASREAAVAKPDILHCHDIYAAAVTGLAQTTGAKLVCTVHGPALYEAKMSYGPDSPLFYAAVENAERKAFAQATRLIAVDKGQARILADDYAVDSNKVVVIANAVDVDQVRTVIKGPVDPRATSPFFLVPRRLVPKTGVRFAIEAMARLRHATARLLIAGDGPQRAELEELTQRLQLSEKVFFLGGVKRDALLPLFATATGVVVPSVPANGVVEATSLAVTEAMAAGTAPIASNIGGLAELIEHDVSGILVPPGDPDALASAFDGLLADEPARQRLIRGATQAVEQKFSLRPWMDQVEAVYRSAADSRQ